MSDCKAIFEASTFLDRVWHEAKHIREAIVAGLEESGIDANEYSDDGHDDDWGDRRWAWFFELNRVYRWQRTPAQLVLYFELSRPGEATGWSYSQEPILIVAYESHLEHGWSVRQLARKSDGILEDKDAEESVELAEGSDHRLFVWDKQERWATSTWGFGVALAELRDRDDVDRNVTRPLISLLIGNEPPNVALNGANAISWPR